MCSVLQKFSKEVPQIPSVDRLHDRYEVDADALGKGAFGTVYHAVHKQTGDECAIKVVKKSSFTSNRQVCCMIYLSH